MTQFNEEVYFQCPYCGEQISMLFESFSGNQEYIEDCEVCCSPIKVNYSVTNGEVILNSVFRLDE